MSNLVLLDSAQHQHLTICPKKAEAHGANVRMVPVMLSEFKNLVIQYPIVIAKNEETGQFVCVSLFGFDDNENLFWTNNSWDAVYTPLHINRQPFFLGLDPKDSKQDKHLICFNADSDSLNQTNGEILFNDDGQETPFMQTKRSILTELLAGESNTQQFINTLNDLALLQVLKIEITFANGESHKVNGIYTIDEEKLAELSAETITDLHRQGYLPHIYTMVASLGHIYSLVQRKNARLSMTPANNQNTAQR